MRQTPLELHLDSHCSLTIVKEKIVGEVSLQSDVVPAFQVLDDFDLESRFCNHASDHPQREPSGPLDGFQYDFCFGVQLHFQRMDRKLFS